MTDVAENQYFATIMQKLPVYDGNGTINYSPIKCCTVYYDEETQMYITEFGEEYLNIKDVVFGTSEESYGVFFLKKVKDLINEYPNTSLEDLKLYYSYENSNSYCSITYDPNKSTTRIISKDFQMEDKVEQVKEVENKPSSYSLQDCLELVMSGKLSKEELLRIKKVISKIEKELNICNETVNEIEKIIEEQLPEQEDKIVTHEERAKILNDLFKDNDNSYSEPFEYNDVCNNIKKAVIGQDEVVESLLAKIHMQLSGANTNLLYFLTGSSGCGKTEICRQLSKSLNRDFVKVNIGSVTAAGYIGESMTDVMYEIYLSCDKDIKRCERAIVLLDELDKKGKPGVNGADVQDELLPIIEGCETNAVSENGRGKTIKYNTSNMVFLGTGAFTDVHKITDKKNHTIGFAKEIPEEYSNITKEDCINYGGMKEEFMNRCSLINLNSLTEENLKEILVTSILSPVENIKEIFKKQNAILMFTEEYYDFAAKKAKDMNCGARVLSELVENSTDFAYRYVITDRMKPLRKIIITEDNLVDNTKFKVEEIVSEKSKIKKLENS